MEIELVRLELGEVRAAARGDDVRAERAAQSRHANLNGLSGGRRRIFAPQLIHQAVDRDRLAGVKQQERQQGALLCALEANLPPFVPDLEGSEDPEVHVGSIVTAP
jgi:hypothetical protein